MGRKTQIKKIEENSIPPFRDRSIDIVKIYAGALPGTDTSLAFILIPNCGRESCFLIIL